MTPQITMKPLVPIVEDFINDIFESDFASDYFERTFDFVEEAIQNSETKLDDVFLLPIVRAGRKVSLHLVSTVSVLKTIIKDTFLDVFESKVSDLSGKCFDMLEEYILDSKSKFDDVTLLPIIQAMRSVF